MATCRTAHLNTSLSHTHAQDSTRQPAEPLTWIRLITHMDESYHTHTHTHTLTDRHTHLWAGINMRRPYRIVFATSSPPSPPFPFFSTSCKDFSKLSFASCIWRLRQFTRKIRQFTRKTRQFTRKMRHFTRKMRIFTRKMRHFTRKMGLFTLPLMHFTRKMSHFTYEVRPFAFEMRNFIRDITIQIPWKRSLFSRKRDEFFRKRMPNFCGWQFTSTYVAIYLNSFCNYSSRCDVWCGVLECVEVSWHGVKNLSEILAASCIV